MPCLLRVNALLRALEARGGRNRALEPGAQLDEKARIDGVRKWVLAVEDVRPGLLETLFRRAAPLDSDDRVVDAVADRNRRQRRREVDLEPFDLGEEAAERENPRRPGTTRAEPERVAHHRALREPAEHGSLRRDPGLGRESVEELGRELIGGQKAVRRRIAELAELVPVRTSRWQRERPARSHADEAPLRVERFQQREEVVLVGAASVKEDERAFGLTFGGTGSVGEAQRVAQLSRGFVIGVRTGSTCSRRCSKFGGSERRSPRLSSGSSVVKPGPIVAISNRTPLGSRK